MDSNFKELKCIEGGQYPLSLEQVINAIEASIQEDYEQIRIKPQCKQSASQRIASCRWVLGMLRRLG